MYRKLNDERTKKHITLSTLANELQCTVSTVSLKLNGKAPLTLQEALTIKEILNSDLSLEELFEETE